MSRKGCKFIGSLRDVKKKDVGTMRDVEKRGVNL